jgi:hypothetical protein
MDTPSVTPVHSSQGNAHSQVPKDNDTSVTKCVDYYNALTIDKKKEMCLKILETFEDDVRLQLVKEILQRNVYLSVKRKNDGAHLTATEHLIIMHNHPTRYIGYKVEVSKDLISDARLLDDLMILSKYCHLDSACHPFYPNDEDLIFTSTSCCQSYKDGPRNKITAIIEMVDIPTFLVELKKHNKYYPTNYDSYYVSEDGKKRYNLKNSGDRIIIHKLAMAKKALLVM